MAYLLTAERPGFSRVQTSELFLNVDEQIQDDHDAPERHAIALALVEAGQANRDAFVSTQTLEEYFSAATRKLKVPAATARGKVELFAQLQVVLISVYDVLGPIDVHRLHQISFWDALLVQTARRAGCTTLLTEDLQDGRRFDGLVVRNPFRSSHDS